MYIVEYYDMVREFSTIDNFMREWFYTYEDFLEDNDIEEDEDEDSEALREIYDAIIYDNIDTYEEEKDWNSEIDCYEWNGYNIFPPKEASWYED